MPGVSLFSGDRTAQHCEVLIEGWPIAWTWYLLTLHINID